LGGADRIATAIAISHDSHPVDGSAGGVVLARSDLFPDALAGTPLALKRNAPLLLTPPAGLDPSTRAELQRVLPAGGAVSLLGGRDALSESVANELGQLGFFVTRYGGADRYETAVTIARDGLGSPQTLLLATGTNFPDALAAGVSAGLRDAAVLLTAGDAQAPATAAYLTSLSGRNLLAVGGPAARAVPSATALVGADRYETAVKVARHWLGSAPAVVVGVASGENFPDAISGGVHIARLGRPLILVPTSSVPDSVRVFLTRSNANITRLYIYGGTVAVSADVVATLRSVSAMP